MSFLAWRMLRGFIPTDDVLMRKGVPIASKCGCCRQMETVEHVFFSNHFAGQLWEYFANVVEIPYTQFTSIQQVIHVWFSENNAGHIRKVIPMVILWILWEARNNSKHNAKPYNFHNLQQRAWHIISTITQASMTKSIYWKGEQVLATRLGAKVYRKVNTQPRVLHWKAPLRGTLKLNIDAAYKEQKSGYGGVLRDNKGDLVHAFGVQGDTLTPLEAEVAATRHILHWCVLKGYRHTRVEVDSELLVKMVKEQRASWRMVNAIAQITQLLRTSNSTLQHIFREVNSAADWVATLAMREERSFIWDDCPPDSQLRAIILLEKEGVPYLRK